ncbi:dihydrofolate reductase [Qipengyuania qiaonensis]|uniref:dihydrofolate reductase n=1 Tax=Qipengyuania qiaonensis TaxID=2867240 RepID=A0ABS7J7N6_9SPHN|nr:dihydrofolate reductase [Qipengyuania qiaonensis]MBX7482326.1 dihydrofolate reductase [Qipengyuania qiaonensis]
MTTLTSIVAVGLDGAIGIQNRLPWRLKSDLRFFKSKTKQNVIIMGRKTYDSLGSCLPDRENLVLSHTPSLFPDHEGCHHVHSIAEALFAREKWVGKEAFVIGGAQTYSQFAPYVDRYLLTIVNARFPLADAFFDQSIFGEESDWDRRELEVERVPSEGADEFDFQVFELKHKASNEVEARRAKIVADFQRRNHLSKPKLPPKSRRATKTGEPLKLFA